MKDIEARWHDFQEQALPRHMDPLDTLAIKGAFYAGAAAAVATITLSDDEQGLHNLYNDLGVYAWAADGLLCPTAH